MISRCIAAMPNVRLLSEVDPLSPINHPPSRFFPTDLIRLARLGTRPPDPAVEVRMFQAALTVLHADSSAVGLDLVLRDHAHSHFCTDADPAGRPTLREIVSEAGPVRSLLTVRHPFDSYLSLKKNGWLHFEPSSPENYARRYHCFLDRHEGVEVMAYEDFSEDPEQWLRNACRLLGLVFDPLSLLAFPSIALSGDSGRSGDVITPRPRSPFPEELRHEAHAARAFTDLLDRLGYAPVPAGE